MQSEHFFSGLKAGKAVSHVISKGWETKATLSVAMDWAGHYVPARPTKTWERGFKQALTSSGYGHLYQGC